jgi:photosystem II stability/assembly factor-like uncharacterized protein
MPIFDNAIAERKHVIRKLRKPALLFLLCAAAASAQSLRQESYSWKNVQIVGAGFVDGVVFHPTAHNLRYARTDMGGAYRWDARANRWQPMLDWISYRDRSLMGVESIAVDPADPNRVYLACGIYSSASSPNGAILRSWDGGRTFERTDVPFKFGGNEDGRGNGERLAVDPGDGRILYVGTRHDGLWRSRDRGASWSRVDSFPDVTEADPPAPAPVPGETPEQRWSRMPVRSDGIVFVRFAPTPGLRSTHSATQTIYVGASLMNRANLFVSKDGGTTWLPVPREPTQYRPTRAAISSDGFLYIAYGAAPGPSRMTNGAVWKLDTRTGKWTEITPERPVPGSREFGYAAVAVDAQHPRTLIASTYDRPGGDDIFRSVDGGATWKRIFGSGRASGVFDSSIAPYVKPTPIHWLFDIEIDPTDPNHAVFTTGYGGWETFDLTAADRGKPTHWRILAQGIEESVALDLVSPGRGAHLISAIGDYGGFVHWNLDRPALVGSSAPPRMGNTSGVAAAALKPEIIVRVGISATGKPGENIGYSLDGGLTWQPTVRSPEPSSRAGTIAVSADGNTWIWTPDCEPAYVTHDRGATWNAARGIPSGLRVVADPIFPRMFYAISLSTPVLYRSSDEGATFTSQPLMLPGDPPTSAQSSRGDDRGGQDRIYAASGRAGDLWLAACDGLYRVASPMQPVAGGKSATFTRLPGVDEIQAFGFGKAAPHHSYPALYLAGTVNGQAGVFRSTDEAHTWTRINDDQHQWGLILQITGDPRIYGRVYVGTHGRGILYGDPMSPPAARPQKTEAAY